MGDDTDDDADAVDDDDDADAVDEVLEVDREVDEEKKVRFQICSVRNLCCCLESAKLKKKNETHVGRK
jgi:hypothetical protein